MKIKWIGKYDGKNLPTVDVEVGAKKLPEVTSKSAIMLAFCQSYQQTRKICRRKHGGKMIYQQDWLMRQIEAMIQAILAVALGISANEQTATQIEDSSYGKMLEKMIDDGDICAAEDLLFNDLDQSDLSWLQIALDFYSKLNNCSDDYLAMHDFSREEIDQGLRYICTLFGYDFLVSN